MDKTEMYVEINQYKDKLTTLYDEFWFRYSGPDTWYFWFNLISVLIPFVILYFAVDRKRLFEICFYGYTTHVLWANLDHVLSMYNIFTYPHTIVHLLPVGVNVTAVIFPITFMLVYQYSTNRNKNFYLYAVIASFLFAYGFGGFAVSFDLAEMHKGMNLTYLFLIDIAIALFAYWITKLFLAFKSKGRST